MTNTAKKIEMPWAGEIIVFKNDYLDCWEYAHHPSREWLARNAGSRPDLMFTPHDTEKEAEMAGREMASHIGASFITRAEWQASRIAKATA